MTPFRRLWLAQTVSMLGDFLALFAVQVAIVFRMHGSASDVASVFIASLAPSIVLGPVAGMFADRWDPRRTMIASDLARGLLVMLLALAVTVPQICAISFAVSCFSTFFSPARTITLPLLVSPELLLAANARMQQSMQLVRIASPAVASALVAAFGERICYAADSATFFCSALLLANLRYRHQAHRAPTRPGFPDLSAGFVLLCTDPRFAFVVFSMTAGTFAAGCFAALAPLYVRDVLHRGPSLLGMIGMLIAAGTLAGSIVMGGLTRTRDPRRLIGCGMAAVGASILLMAAEPRQAAALIGSTGIGLGVALVVLAATVMLQAETPPELRGRVSGASAALTSIAQLGALLLAGAGAAHLGIRGVFAFSAALLFATGACGFKLGHRGTDRTHSPSVSRDNNGRRVAPLANSLVVYRRHLGHIQTVISCTAVVSLARNLVCKCQGNRIVFPTPCCVNFYPAAVERRLRLWPAFRRLVLPVSPSEIRQCGAQNHAEK